MKPAQGEEIKYGGESIVYRGMDWVSGDKDHTIEIYELAFREASQHVCSGSQSQEKGCSADVAGVICEEMYHSWQEYYVEQTDEYLNWEPSSAQDAQDWWEYIPGYAGITNARRYRPAFEIQAKEAVLALKPDFLPFSDDYYGRQQGEIRNKWDELNFAPSSTTYIWPSTLHPLGRVPKP